MPYPVEAILVIGSPIFAEPLRRWLESGPEGILCRVFAETDPPVSATPGAAAILLIAPQDWRELARWLPCLRRQFSGRTWLLLANLRLAGLFWPYLESERCALLSPDSPPESLPIALGVLAGGQTFCPASELLRLFHERAPLLPDGTRPVLTTREFQCGCAFSLGLTNQQMADLLHLGLTTVKGHVGHLMRKLHTTDRDDVTRYFERALASSSSTFGIGS